MLIPLRLKSSRNIICPVCQGTNIKFMHQRIEGGYWKYEEYFCNDCQCEWDWTLRHPFFRPHLKIRPPQWVKID